MRLYSPPSALSPTACPLHLSPRSPYADDIFPRPSLYHDLHAHGDQRDPLISQASATSHFAFASSKIGYLLQFGIVNSLSLRAPFSPIRLSFPLYATRRPCARATCPRSQPLTCLQAIQYVKPSRRFPKTALLTRPRSCLYLASFILRQPAACTLRRCRGV